MQTRHRIPTIFNLSMVDVLCCALGCIILLWLVYFKDAREKSVAAGQVNKQLAETKTKLDKVLLDLMSANADVLAGKTRDEYLSGQLAALTTDRDQVLAKWEKSDKDYLAAMQFLKDAQAAIAALRTDVKKLEAAHANANAALAQKTKEHGDLSALLLTVKGNMSELEKTVGAQKGAMTLSAAAAADLKAKLAEAVKNATNLEKVVGDQKDIIALSAAEAAALQVKLAAAEKNASSLEKAVGDQKGVLAMSAAEAADLKAKLAAAEKIASDLEKVAFNSKDALVLSAAQAAELKEKLAEAEKNISNLAKLVDDHKGALVLSAGEAADYKAKLAAAEKLANTLEKASGDQKGALALSAAQAAALNTKLAQAEINAGKLEQQLSTYQVLAKEYSQQLAKAESKAMLLQRELDDRKLELAESRKRYDQLLTVKNLLEQSLAANTGDLAKSQQALALVKGELDKSETALASLKLTSHGLVGETKMLAQEVNKLRAVADNRFAGIELTGSRVIFMVDMSGSMGMKDDKSENPEKWILVCEILGKLMGSLPDLKQYQVIMFSDHVRYPLGKAGQWHDYHGALSLKYVVDSVRAVKPESETNMSAGFEEAFKFRATGLDTIYLLSDGLPTAGDGLPTGGNKLSANDQSLLLSKYIRDRLKKTWNVPYGRWAQQRVRINAVGFYFDSPDVGAFLWALARDNDGSFVGLSKP